MMHWSHNVMILAAFMVPGLLRANPPEIKDPPADMPLKTMRTNFFNEVTRGIEGYFDNRLLKNSLGEKLINNGIYPDYEELRRLERRLTALSQNKPNLYSREAINVNLHIFTSENMTLKALDAEIARWESYMEAKRKALDVARQGNANQIVEWLEAERAWGGSVLWELGQTRQVLVDVYNKWQMGRYFLSKVFGMAPEERLRYVNNSCVTTIFGW